MANINKKVPPTAMPVICEVAKSKNKYNSDQESSIKTNISVHHKD